MPVATASVSSFNPTNQIGPRDPSGEQFGVANTDLIGFWGATPIAQPLGNAQAALTRGTAGGCLATSASTQSPTAVGPNTTVESTLTLTGATGTHVVTSGDLVYVTKPTSQAGLGIANVRVQATGAIGLAFTNFTAATVTPTASEKYGVVFIRGFASSTLTLSPSAVAPNTFQEQTFAMTGARVGELIQAMKPTSQAGLVIGGCRVVSNNTIGINFGNVTAATITPTASEAYIVQSLNGVDAVSNEIVFAEPLTAAGVNVNTSAEQTLTVTGLLATDVVRSVSKPAWQAGLAIVNARVQAANSLGISYGNFTAATITPTAAEINNIHVFRPAPVAPMLIYTASLSPAAVAPNTTAEQTFTVTGLVNNTPVWVNKPSAQTGLAVVGWRVTATNSLGITFGNATAATITPTAAESYIVGNFQIPIGDGNATIIQGGSPPAQAIANQSNAVRLALTNAGLIAGA